MRFSEDFLDELRYRNDIESVVSSYVSLKTRGRTMVGLCPFHNEKTPSFTVYLDTQSYYCFGCGAGGDCVTFIKTAENLSYTEAVKYLAEKSGMSLPAEGYDDAVLKLRQRIYEANRLAARFYYSVLTGSGGDTAREYLNRRRLTPEICAKFGIGFAPDSWDALVRHMRGRGFGEEELIAASLARKTKNGGCIDLFRNRLMFPVIDLRGNVIAFSGRVLDDSLPKYINSPETLVYKKSQVLYALNYAKNNNSGKLILCEGNMDVIALHQAGFTNAVAAMGTSFTAGHAKLLSGYADEVLLAFDSDAAGQKAVNKVITILSSTNLKTKVIKMTGGKDPDEIIRLHGRERMSDILNGAVNDTEFRLGSTAAGIDTGTADGKLTYLRSAVEILAALNNPIERDIYITKISSELEVSKEAINEQIAKEIKKRKRHYGVLEFTAAQKKITGHPKITDDDKAYSAKTKNAEEILIKSLIQNPDYYKKIVDKIEPEDFFSDTNKNLFFAAADMIRDNRNIELSFFTGRISDGEMSVLARLINDKTVMANTLDGCLQCINTLKMEKQKQEKIDPAKMSDEDIKNITRES